MPGLPVCIDLPNSLNFPSFTLHFPPAQVVLTRSVIQNSYRVKKSPILQPSCHDAHAATGLFPANCKLNVGSRRIRIQLLSYRLSLKIIATFLKVIPLQAWIGPYCSRKVVRLSYLLTGRLYSPRVTPGTHFWQRKTRPQDHSVPCRINPLNAELNPTCHLLAVLGAHHILHVSRIRVIRGTEYFGLL